MLLSLPTHQEAKLPLIETKTIGELSAQKPTLVFLHEGLGSVSLWRDFPAQLCDRLDIAGFLYSRNGYGQSPIFSESLSADFMHVEAQQSLPELLRANQINHPIGPSHSPPWSWRRIFLLNRSVRRRSAHCANALSLTR